MILQIFISTRPLTYPYRKWLAYRVKGTRQTSRSAWKETDCGRGSHIGVWKVGAGFMVTYYSLPYQFLCTIDNRFSPKVVGMHYLQETNKRRKILKKQDYRNVYVASADSLLMILLCINHKIQKHDATMYWSLSNCYLVDKNIEYCKI